MWEDYFGELLGCHTIKHDDIGFVCYQEFPDNLFIHHFYVRPKFRAEGIQYTELMISLIAAARAKGKKRITACCDQETKTYKQSLKAALNQGFKISAVAGTVVYTYLELGEE